MVTEERQAERSWVRAVAVRKLEADVEDTRRKLVQRARSLAAQLRQLADGLEQDPDYNFNTLGELQWAGVELDGWCVKLGFARETLRTLRQALAEDERAGRA